MCRRGFLGTIRRHILVQFSRVGCREKRERERERERQFGCGRARGLGGSERWRWRRHPGVQPRPALWRSRSDCSHEQNQLQRALKATKMMTHSNSRPRRAHPHRGVAKPAGGLRHGLAGNPAAPRCPPRGAAADVPRPRPPHRRRSRASRRGRRRPDRNGVLGECICVRIVLEGMD
jgi:hypothetical protein